MIRICFLALLALAVTASSDTVPEQIHIAYAGRDAASGHPTGMRVAWYTQDVTANSTVQFGTASGALSQSASASAAPVQYLKGNGYHHVVNLANLPAGTQVFYRVGDGSTWSDEFSFTTAPSAAEPFGTEGKDSFAVSVFGDMGWLDSDQRPMVIAVAGLVKHWSATVTRTRLETLRPSLDFVWHLGDIGYADDAFAHHPLGFYYEKCYNGFMNWMQNLSATMPYMVSVGNHESECHSPNCMLSGHAKSLSNFSAYNARWHMPAGESAVPARPGHSMWYSWDYANVHFVSVNSETDWDGAEEKDTGDSHDKKLPAGHFGEDGEYLAWLEADLKAASEARERARTDRGGALAQYGMAPTFIVAGGHRPYGFSAEHQALFSKYGVDLHVSGHGHSYTRGAPINGTTYIMAGGAGCDEMDYLESPHAQAAGIGADWARLAKGPQYGRQGHEPEGELFQTVYKTGKIASGVLTVNATAMHWDLIDSVSGAVIDTVDIAADVQHAARDAARSTV